MYVHIVDKNFESYLLKHFDDDLDGAISSYEAQKIYKIDCKNLKIKTLAGIENFDNLVKLDCSGNKLEMLDLSQNHNLYYLNCSNMPTLKDLNLIVRHHYKTLVLPSDMNFEKESYQRQPSLHFDDENFEMYLIAYADRNSDGDISQNEAEKVKNIDCSYLNIKSIDEIKYFTNLERLDCSGNLIKKIDVSENKKLEYLTCFDMSDLEDVYLIEGREYKKIILPEEMSYLKEKNETEQKQPESVSKPVKEKPAKEKPVNSKPKTIVKTKTLKTNNAATDIIDFDDTNFKTYLIENFDRNGDGEISFSEAKKVKEINCGGRNIKSISGIENFEKLERLSCSDNNIEKIDVSNLDKLKFLDCSKNNLLRTIKTGSGGLTSTYPATISTFTSYNSRKQTFVEYINFPDANFKKYLVDNFDTNRDGTISATEAANIRDIDCSNKGIKSLWGINYLTSLRYLNCSGNEISEIDVSQNKRLQSLLCAPMPSLKKLTLAENVEYGELEYPETAEILGHTRRESASEFIKISDYAFRDYLIEKFDYNSDGMISAAEAAMVEEIECSGRGIETLAGIEYFTALKTLYCSKNNLKELDLSHNANLQEVICSKNPMTKLSAKNCDKLRILYCQSSSLVSLNLEKCKSLKELFCDNNIITKMDLSDCVKLEELICYNNELANLDVSKNTQLTRIKCSSNQLQTLDVSKNIMLNDLDCQYNAITNLDLSRNAALVNLDCEHNMLSVLDLRGNKKLRFIDCNEMPSLHRLILNRGQNYEEMHKLQTTQIEY